MSREPQAVGNARRQARTSLAQTNRWHPVMLPDDYIRKMRQALGEVEAKVEAETRRERVLDDRPSYDFDQSPPDDDV
jgi:hypothetical protein